MRAFVMQRLYLLVDLDVRTDTPEKSRSHVSWFRAIKTGTLVKKEGEGVEDDRPCMSGMFPCETARIIRIVEHYRRLQSVESGFTTPVWELQ